MDEIEIEYTLTIEDGVACHKYLARRALGPRWLLLLLPVFVVGSSLFFASLDKSVPPQKGPGSGVEVIVVFLAPIVILFVFLFLVFPRISARSTRATLRKSNWLGQYRLTATPESFTIASDLTTVMSRWDAVKRVETSDAYVLIFTGPHAAHVIPRRAFSDQQEVDDFVATIKRYCCQIAR